jgi:hypothetical protein
MIHEFRQPLEVSTPLGDGVALLLIDYGWGANTCWVVILKDGVVKHFDSNDVIVQPIHTWGLMG